MLSAEPQVRGELFENDYLFSDRMGVLTFEPLVFRNVGDIQNKLLSEKRTAMAAIEDNGIFTIWTGTFDKNGMPLPGTNKTTVFSSVAALHNEAKIGPAGKPYSFGFAGNKLKISALGKGGQEVGVLAETPSYTIGSTVKVKLMDNGALNLYISEALFWSTMPITPTAQNQVTNAQNTNLPTSGNPAGNNSTPTQTNLFSNPLLLIAGLFAAYKFLK